MERIGKRESKNVANEGITLVALVVTVVVLLILAGITINLMLGPNSIFEMAKKAGEETNKAAENELTMLNELASYFNEQGWGNYTGGGNDGETGNTPTPEIPKGPNGKPLVGSIEKDNENNQVVEDKNGNPITIPAGFHVVPNSPDGTDPSEKVTYSYNGDGTPAVQDGIVIEDEEGNQFVWIPVGEVKNKDGSTTTITLGRYIFDSSGNPTLQQDSVNYTQTVTIYSYYQELEDGTSTAPAKNLGEFIAKTKNAGGYYLARYEASQGEDGKVDSQADKAVWLSMGQQTASGVARNMYSNSSYDSDLINSYSWDTAIVFIEKTSEGNSNYANQNTLNTSKLNTGKSGDLVCNIHDMASNCYEWSTEYSSYRGVHYAYNCVSRGGNYNNTKLSTYTRSTDGITTSGLDFVTFRCILYCGSDAQKAL